MPLVLLAVALLAQPTTATDGWTQYAEPPPRTERIERLVQCESGDRAMAKNKRSSASGTFQFIDSTWEWVTGLSAPARKYPLYIQRQAFDRLWADGAGASHWECA